jgi:hypothetical protein
MRLRISLKELRLDRNNHQYDEFWEKAMPNHICIKRIEAVQYTMGYRSKTTKQYTVLVSAIHSMNGGCA